MAEKFKLKFAVYLIPRRDNKVLLSLRENTGYMDGMYSLVAGHVDGGETGEEATIREAAEEAGVMIDPKDLKFAYIMHRLKNRPEDEYIDLFFEVRNWEGEFVNNEPEKCGGLDWFDIDKLPENTLPYISEAVTSYESGKHYSSTKGTES